MESFETNRNYDKQNKATFPLPLNSSKGLVKLNKVMEEKTPKAEQLIFNM